MKLTLNELRIMFRVYEKPIKNIDKRAVINLLKWKFISTGNHSMATCDCRITPAGKFFIENAHIQVLKIDSMCNIIKLSDKVGE